MTTNVQYTDAIGDWTVKTDSLADHIAHLQRSSSSPTTRCEYLQHGTPVVPYFDFDLTQNTAPTSQQLQAAWDLCHSTLMHIFGTDPAFDFDTRVAHAHRHGFVPSKNLHKISFRFWIRGFSILPEHMPVLIRSVTPPEMHGVFDLSIYSARRLLAVVGGIKGNGDDRVLQPAHSTMLEWCICQRLEGDEVFLDLAAEAAGHASKALVCQGTRPEDWDRLETLLVAAGFQDPVYRGGRQLSVSFTCGLLGISCPCCPWVHDSQDWWVMQKDDGSHIVKNYSSRCRTMLLQKPVVVEDITPINPDMPVQQAIGIYLNNMGFPDMCGITPGECYTLKQHLENCPTCRKGHASGSSYLVETLVNQCYTVRNDEKHCHGRIIDIESMVENHAGLKRILENPDTDTPLAHLYVQECGRSLVACGDTVFKFRDNRWSVIETADLENDVLDFLDKILRGLMTLLHHEEGYRQQANVQENVKRFQKLRASFAKAVRFGESSSHRKLILTSIRTKVHDSSLNGRWDKSETLLGLDGGVVDLDTGLYRPALKEDYITMSCGYDWLDTVDPRVEAHLEDFISQVYPVPEEREFMQRYCYYCLLGVHREKIFLVLNDLRGGWNGKSTFLSLLMITMGDYAIKADACVLYKQDRLRGINDHAGGLLAFEKKRLMVVEETSSGAVLDEEKLKDWHGSRARVSGRQLHSKEMHEFEWITKLILAANEGKLPHWSVQDLALTERIATVPHRSRFQHPPLPEEPYTYPVDTRIKDRFPEWRPYMLRWCLGGRQRYQELGFTQMPTGCLAFKQTIMDEKDVVKEWLSTAIEGGGAEDFVKVCDLYTKFCSDNRSFQADRKTKKTPKMFERELHRCLDKEHFKSKHHYKMQGRSCMAGKVFTRYKVTDTEVM